MENFKLKKAIYFLTVLIKDSEYDKINSASSTFKTIQIELWNTINSEIREKEDLISDIKKEIIKQLSISKPIDNTITVKVNELSIANLGSTSVNKKIKVIFYDDYSLIQELLIDDKIIDKNINLLS